MKKWAEKGRDQEKRGSWAERPPFSLHGGSLPVGHDLSSHGRPKSTFPILFPIRALGPFLYK